SEKKATKTNEKNHPPSLKGRERERRGGVRRVAPQGESGCIKCAGPHFFPQQPRHINASPTILPPAPHQTWIRTLRQYVVQLADEIGTAVLIDCNVIDVRQRDTGLGETKCDRLQGKAGPVFDATEPLLFSSRDQLAVENEPCRQIAVKTVEPKNNHGKSENHSRQKIFQPSHSAVLMTLRPPRSRGQPSLKSSAAFLKQYAARSLIRNMDGKLPLAHPFSMSMKEFISEANSSSAARPLTVC